jgi:hypothetical protein
MANVVYNGYKLAVAANSINLVSDTIKVLLVTASYTPDQDTHVNLSDVTNEVASGGGYTTGGITLTGKAVSVDLVNNRAKFIADAATWSAATLTARGAILYKDTGVAGTSTLITYKDFGSDKTASGGNFTIDWDTTGIIRFE